MSHDQSVTYVPRLYQLPANERMDLSARPSPEPLVGFVTGRVARNFMSSVEAHLSVLEGVGVKRMLDIMARSSDRAAGHSRIR